MSRLPAALQKDGQQSFFPFLIKTPPCGQRHQRSVKKAQSTIEIQATIDHGQSTCRTTRQTALADKDKSNFKLQLFQLMRSACGMPQICHNSCSSGSSRSHQIRSPWSVSFALHYMPDFNCTRNCLESINIYRTTNDDRTSY